MNYLSSFFGEIRSSFWELTDNFAGIRGRERDSTVIEENKELDHVTVDSKAINLYEQGETVTLEDSVIEKARDMIVKQRIYKYPGRYIEKENVYFFGAKKVLFPNSSLECSSPDPFALYTSSLVPGYTLRFIYQDMIFHAHSSDLENFKIPEININPYSEDVLKLILNCFQSLINQAVESHEIVITYYKRFNCQNPSENKKSVSVNEVHISYKDKKYELCFDDNGIRQSSNLYNTKV
jgi:hypothetical protein